MSKLARVMRVLFALFLVMALCSFLFVYLVTVPPGKGKAVIFTIAPGEKAQDVALRLEREKLVSSSIAFRALMRISRGGPRIMAGDYELSPQMNSMEILRKIVRGEVAVIGLTIPEGSTVKDIADMIERKEIMASGEFIGAACDNRNIMVAGMTPRCLEGFLFPETYQIPLRACPEDMVRLMTDRFEEEVLPLFQSSPRGRKNGLMKSMVMASLVEKEAKLDGERARIASVYYNRLDKGMELQCDATVSYALGKFGKSLGYEDLRCQSPYNTYVHRGLPPGPICNPGIKSIRAALYPESTGYLFYVLNEKVNDGSHLFTCSYQEHLRAVESSSGTR